MQAERKAIPKIQANTIPTMTPALEQNKEVDFNNHGCQIYT